MKYAKSMRFAGMLLDAENCDYTDFINHGLRCPICSGTVFLVASSNRESHSRKLKSGESVSVKQSSVPAHFSHHSSDKFQIADCELRSAKITQTQKQAFQAQARGQIARLFRQKFFSMVQTSITFRDTHHSEIALLGLWQQASISQPMKSKAQLGVMIDMLTERVAKEFQSGVNLQSLELSLSQWIDKFMSDPLSLGLSFHSQIKQWLNVLDARMQCVISIEATNYLANKAQKPLLAALVQSAVYNLILQKSNCEFHGLNNLSKIERSGKLRQILNQQEKEEWSTIEFTQLMVSFTRSMVGMDSKSFEDLVTFCFENVIEMLLFVDWAKQFEGREV